MNWNWIAFFAMDTVAIVIVGVVAYWLGRQVGYSRGYRAGQHPQPRSSNGRFIPNAPAKGSDVAE